MNDEEKELVLMLNDVYEKYAGLPEQHRDDMKEFVNALHVLQHLVMIRGVRRANPSMFPLQLDVDVKVDSIEEMDDRIGRAVSETLNNALKNNRNH